MKKKMKNLEDQLKKMAETNGALADTVKSLQRGNGGEIRPRHHHVGLDNDPDSEDSGVSDDNDNDGDDGEGGDEDDAAGSEDTTPAIFKAKTVSRATPSAT